MNFNKTSIASLISVLVGSSPVFAQETSNNVADEVGIEEIIVTAQRRAQNLQDVPISISAFNDESITQNDINSISKLGDQVPGMVVVTGAERTNISVRGVGSTITNISAEAGVPVNIDGVYMTRVTLTGATYGDLEQIEVLKGPQGTLYGRNATGGTVNIWTKKPDGTLNGDVSALVANAGRQRLRAAVGFPINGDELSARIGFEVEDVDGYRDNLFLGEKADPEEHRSGRAVVRWAPNDDFEMLLRASVSTDDTGGPIIQYGEYIGGPFSPLLQGGLTSDDPTNVRADQRTVFEFEDEVYSAELSWKMGNTTLKSLTAYQSHDMYSLQDTDGTSADYAVVEFIESSPAFTQEITLSGGNDRLDWVTGLWYMDDEASSFMNFNLAGLSVPDFILDFKQETEAYAVFAQATYNITDKMRTTLGLRYSDETKTLTQTVGFPPPLCTNLKTENKYDDLSPKIAVDYDLADNVMVYVSATKGFKAGGGNNAVCGNTYDPEELWAYEAGVKSDWFENRLRFNANAYYYDYEGYQASQLIPPASIIIVNATDATLQGFEIELRAELMDGLSFDLGAAWSDSEFKDFITAAQLGGPPADVSGNSLVASPDFSGSAAFQYQANVSDTSLLTMRLVHSWNSGYFLDVYNSSFTEQESFGLTNARISYAVESGSLNGLEVSLYVNNIEDEDVLSRGDASSLFGGTRLSYNLPRTYGAELRYRFGQ